MSELTPGAGVGCGGIPGGVSLIIDLIAAYCSARKASCKRQRRGRDSGLGWQAETGNHAAIRPQAARAIATRFFTISEVAAEKSAAVHDDVRRARRSPRVRD